MPLYQASPFRRNVGWTRTPVSHTGDTAETVLATITVPLGLMGTNGRLEIPMLVRCVATNGTRTVRVRQTNVSGTVLFQSALGSTVLSAHVLWWMWQMGATNAQASVGIGPSGIGTGTSANDIISPAIDTTQDFALVITGALASAADTVTLEAYDAYVTRPA